MALRASLWTCVLAACSPFGGGAFECSLDQQCGAAGICSGGFCSFPDSDCASGLRYGEHSGPSSNQCVDEQPVTSDGGVDAFVPSDAFACYGTGLVRVCFREPPTGTLTLPASIDTDTAPECQAVEGSSAWCVIAGESITVTGTVAVRGPRPLVLVATNAIVVEGTLDAASRRVDGKLGPAANASACLAGTAPTGNKDGGAGGSFGGKGGDGGGAGKGVAGAAITPTSLHGGCRGQDGGGANKGSGGNGGGAVYLIAEAAISVTGTINASGAGGGAGTATQSGGGGGGSGGMIGLDAPTVAVTNGSIFANGGGGGEGGTSGGNAGGPGADPASATTSARGGSTSSSGGDGGDGAAGATLTGAAGRNGLVGSGGVAGSGGGGGGAGIIKLYRAGSISGDGVSPPPS